uniref:CRAL-TRIO domain-containing protein n=2 Tax=Rhodnius prolixus TaxID=13249 RepID=T1HKZ1_RHOPR
MNEKWWKVSKEEEYKRNKKLKSSDVALIQEWLKKQPHLPKLNDNQVIMFLTACEYSLEQTKETIDLNYTMRTKLPELFAQRDLKRKALQISMEYMELSVMPELHEGTVVVLYKLKEMDMSKYLFEEYVKLSNMVLDVTHMELGSAQGYNYIHDLKHFTFNHILQTPIASLANTLKYLQEASTCHIRGIHFINGGTVFEKLLAVIKPFLNADVMKMLKNHPNYESLRKTVDIKAIPSDYGGEAPSVQELNKKTLATLKQYEDWFPEEEKQRNDEKKRTSNINKDYGIQGSFRKLDLD